MPINSVQPPRRSPSPRYVNNPEAAGSDALCAPFMHNPRKPVVDLEAGDGPKLILHYLRYAPWSAKAEMALRHMGLLGSQVAIRDVDILAWFNPKRSPIARLWESGIPRMIPLLEDVESEHTVVDSTPIMRYLEQRFPEAPRLFSGTGRAVEDFCIAIDSGLALSARRLFVTRLVLDRRDVLGWAWGGAHHPKLTRGWRALVHQTVMGAVLVRRLGLAQNVEEGLYERVRLQMDAAAAALGSKRWVFERFGAADMALAASIASLAWVSWLRCEPRYEALFAHQLRVYARLGMRHTQPSVVRGILDPGRPRTPLWRRILAVPYRVTLEIYLRLAPEPSPSTADTVYGQVFVASDGEGMQSAPGARNDQRPFENAGVAEKCRYLLDYAFGCQRQRRWMESGCADSGPVAMSGWPVGASSAVRASRLGSGVMPGRPAGRRAHQSGLRVVPGGGGAIQVPETVSPRRPGKLH